MIVYTGSREEFYELALSIEEMCYHQNIQIMLILDELTVLAGKTVIAHKETMKRKADYIGENDETILTLIKKENSK